MKVLWIVIIGSIILGIVDSFLGVKYDFLETELGNFIAQIIHKTGYMVWGYLLIKRWDKK